jgi:hypothetical protein
MQLEDQVCSLELAKRLKELNIKQDSLFYWHNIDGISSVICNNYPPERSGDFWISAFTVAELLSSLPQRVTSPEFQEPYNSFRFRFEKGIWSVGNSCDTGSPQFSEFYSANYYCDTTSLEMDWHYCQMTKNQCDENPVNALAKMLIFLIENKLI